MDANNRFSRNNPPVKGRYLTCIKDNWVFIASKKYLIINVGKDLRHHGAVTLRDCTGSPRSMALRTVNSHFIDSGKIKHNFIPKQVICAKPEPTIEFKYFRKRNEYCDSCKKTTKHVIMVNELICTRCYNNNNA